MRDPGDPCFEPLDIGVRDVPWVEVGLDEVIVRPPPPRSCAADGWALASFGFALFPLVYTAFLVYLAVRYVTLPSGNEVMALYMVPLCLLALGFERLRQWERPRPVLRVRAQSLELTVGRTVHRMRCRDLMDTHATGTGWQLNGADGTRMHVRTGAVKGRAVDAVFALLHARAAAALEAGDTSDIPESLSGLRPARQTEGG